MSKLYGYKRWYEVKNEKYPEKNIMKKIKVIRKYTDGVYRVLKDEIQDKNSILNFKFIREIKKYKVLAGKELTIKFSIGNILFKLPLEKKDKYLETNKVIKKIEILEQSKELSELSKKINIEDRKNNKFTRKNICNELIKKFENGEIKENSEELNIRGKTIKLEISEKFDKNQDAYAIRWKILSEEEQKQKKDLYEEAKKINQNLYNLLEYSKKNTELYYKRYYLENLESKYLEKKDDFSDIFSNFEKIKKIAKIGNLVSYIKFLLNIERKTDKKNISENKIHFVNKIFNYIESDISITHNDIIEFLIGELNQYELIKRIEKVPKDNLDETKLIRTFITLDKHEKYVRESEKKNIAVKQIIDKIMNSRLEKDIKGILDFFEVKKLKEKLEFELSKNGIDTNLFGVLKIHYKDICEERSEINIENLPLEDKELYKITYRYLKGRIEKILNNRKIIKLNGKNKNLNDIFNEKMLLQKIIKRVEQYCLEHILYLGKIEQLLNGNIKKVNTNEFKEEHANEELALELMTLFSTTNMVFNEFFEKEIKEENTENHKYEDYFGSKLKKNDVKIITDKIALKYEIFEKLGFIEKDKFVLTDIFEEFLKKTYSIRSKILHGKYKEVFYLNNLTERSEDYIRFENTIKYLRVPDSEICRSLNLDIVFQYKEKIIDTINNLYMDKNETLDKKEQKYLPSFNKIVPEIKKEIQRNDINSVFYDEKLEKIISNAAIYVNKILYLKEISNSESGFIKCLNEKFKKEGSIESAYKMAQISASKGNKKAIKKYQKLIIEEYLSYLKNSETLKDVLDFSDFRDNLDEVIKKINNKNEIEDKFVLKSTLKNVLPRTNFEYIIAVLCLFNDNIFVNKIRNRFLATDSWLENNKNDNIIFILDEIISCNVIKDELESNKYELGLIKIEELIKNISKEEENHQSLVNKKNKIEIELSRGTNDGLFLNNDKKEEFNKILMIEKSGESNFKIVSEIIEKKLYDIDYQICGSTFKTRNKFLFKPKDGIENSYKPIFSKEINTFSDSIKKYLEKEKSKLDKEIVENRKKFPLDTLKQYNILMESLSQNKNFKNIYFQEKNKNMSNEIEKKYIYKKKIFYNCSKHNFSQLYSEFLKNDLEGIDVSMFELEKIVENREIPKKIIVVNNVLEKINNDYSGYSKNYKDRMIKEIKSKNFKSLSKIFKTTSYIKYEDFLEDYNKISEYRKNRDITEFNILNKVSHYLAEINWKLAIQMARIERDLHYMIRGLDKLNIIELKRDGQRKLELNTEKSRAYPKYKNDKLELEDCYYKFELEKDYINFENICGQLGIDLSRDGELQKENESNIRNYISHFYLVRSPFIDNESIAEKIDRVDSLLSYRTKYRNSTYNSVFEVFKKDVDLVYEQLKKKIKLAEILEKKELNTLIKIKRVSILELEHYNGANNIELIKKLLIVKNLKSVNK